jgi:Cu(I)/Ag(I) efflux system membrane fusion protein/cobalt-zinc-cadmium efflux system membrane fusion protein
MDPQVIQEGPGNCPICGMKLTPLKQETSSAVQTGSDSTHQNRGQERKVLYWRAPMDPEYISDKPGKSPMGMDLIPVYEDDEIAEGIAISIDPVTVQNMGVRTAVVKRQDVSRTIRTVGHIDYDEQGLTKISLKFSGWI